MSAFALVHLGDSVPSYLADCLRQIRRFNPVTPLYLIVDHESAELKAVASSSQVTLVNTTTFQVTDEIQRFEKASHIDRTWRNGFNFHAIKRFFFLECLLREHHLESVVHMEYDNLIYFELAFLSSAFEKYFPRLGLILDNDQRCVPGLLYIRDSRAMKGFLRWYLAWAIGRDENDMVALARYQKKKLGRYRLPLLPSAVTLGQPKLTSPDGHVVKNPRCYSELAQVFGGVFDGAAIGQFLGGVDPRNQAGDTKGFVNEASVFPPAHFDYTWKSDQGGRRLLWAQPHGKGEPFQVLSLHVHSKNLRPFLS